MEELKHIVMLIKQLIQSTDNAVHQTAEHLILLQQLIFVLQVFQGQSMAMVLGIGHATDKMEEQINLVAQTKQ
jgi:hypothetical protein